MIDRENKFHLKNICCISTKNKKLSETIGEKINHKNLLTVNFTNNHINLIVYWHKQSQRSSNGNTPKKQTIKRTHKI